MEQRLRTRELRSEIEINAPASRVWSILTSLSDFADWNPFVRQAEGELEEGEQLRVRIAPPNGREMGFKPTVTRVDPGRELRWLGHFLVPGLFDGEHIFEISPSGDHVRFVQRERFHGILVPLLWSSLATRTQQGFEAMNAALKRRAEAGGAR